MYDEKHYNYWEPWFRKAFNVDEFSTYNTAWLTYFIAGGSIAYSDQRYAFKKILQTVYTSMPDIIGVLFLMSKSLAKLTHSLNDGLVDHSGRLTVFSSAFNAYW